MTLRIASTHLVILDELLDAVCKWYKRRYNTVITPDEVASVFGTQEGMAHIALALCNPGDLCLVPNPGYLYSRLDHSCVTHRLLIAIFSRE